jgi:hypothetical protein
MRIDEHKGSIGDPIPLSIMEDVDVALIWPED